MGHVLRHPDEYAGAMQGFANEYRSLSSYLKVAQRERDTTQATLVEVQTYLQQSRQELDLSETAKRQSQADADQLRVSLKSTTQEKNQLHWKLEGERRSRQMLTDKVESLERSEGHLQFALESVERERRVVQGMYDTSSEALDEAVSGHWELYEKLNAEQHAVSFFQKEAEKADGRTSEVEKKFEDAQNTQERLEKEKRTLTGDLNVSEMAKLDAEKEVSRLSGELDETKKQRDEWKKQSDDKVAIIDTLRTQLATKTRDAAELPKLRTEHKQHEAKIHKLEIDIAIEQEKRSKVEATLSDIVKELDLTKEQLDISLADETKAATENDKFREHFAFLVKPFQDCAFTLNINASVAGPEASPSSIEESKSVEAKTKEPNGCNPVTTLQSTSEGYNIGPLQSTRADTHVPAPETSSSSGSISNASTQLQNILPGSPVFVPPFRTDTHANVVVGPKNKPPMRSQQPVSPVNADQLPKAPAAGVDSRIVGNKRKRDHDDQRDPRRRGPLCHDKYRPLY